MDAIRDCCEAVKNEFKKLVILYIKQYVEGSRKRERLYKRCNNKIELI